MKMNLNENYARVEKHSDNSSYVADKETSSVKGLLQRYPRARRLNQNFSTTAGPNSNVYDGLTKQIFAITHTSSQKNQGWPDIQY